MNSANLDGTTALIVALKKGNGKCASILVQAGADVNICDKSQKTPLIYAAQNIDIKSEVSLLKAGADVNKQDGYQCTALMWTVGKHINLKETGPSADVLRGYDIYLTPNEEKDVHESLACLLQAGADVNIRDSFGHTAGCTKCVNMLIKAGADVNMKNEVGEDALAISLRLFGIGTPGWRECTYLLIMAGANVNGEVLYRVAEKGNAQCVKKCIDAGADVNYESCTGGNTPLTATIKNRYGYMYGHGQFDLCTRYLLAAGANVNHSGVYGETALHAACEMGRDGIIETLLNAGADVNLRTSKGDTALLMAVQHKRVSSVRLLIKAGADVNIQGHCQFSPLHLAYNDCMNESPRLLLRAGVMINVMDNKNQNALQHAIAQRGGRPTFMLLFAAGETIEGTTVKKYDIWDNVKHIPVPDYLQDFTVPKLCLKHECRMMIRKHLISIDPHTHLFTRAPELRLPTTLLEYVLLNIALN